MVPSREAFTPSPATGFPVTVTGGQAVAQSPLQVDFEEVSASQRYRVRPSPSTRMVPSGLDAAATVPDPCVPADAEADAVSLLPLSSEHPPSTAASRLTVAAAVVPARFRITNSSGPAAVTAAPWPEQ